MKRHILFSLISGLLLAVQATQAAAPRVGNLINAADDGDVARVRELIAAGADVNAQNSFGYTALMWAIVNGHAEIVQVLLAVEGIDVNALNQDEYTDFILAAARGHAEIIQALLAAGAPLLAAGAQVNAHERPCLYGNTVLIKAANEGHADDVRALLAIEGIDVNAQNQYGNTALMYATYRGHADVVRALLDAGADKAITNTRDETALGMATRRGHHEIIALLGEAYVKSAGKQ